MPELPEVTTTVRGLNKCVKNLVIMDIWSDWPKLIKSPSFEDFKKSIRNKKILESERWGKNILIKLSDDKTLLIHMKMTGHLMYGKWREARNGDQHGWNWIPLGTREGGARLDANFPDVSEQTSLAPRSLVRNHPLHDPYNRFIHLIFFLSNGRQLTLSDVRKFAKVLLIDNDKIAEHSGLKSIGPEPLNKNFTPKKLAERLSKKSNWPVKQALMSQELVAGIGNIYSDEILWRAGIHPLQKVSETNQEKIRKIHAAMKTILKKSISFGGDSTSDYRNIHGERGGFQHAHMVYRKTGKKCLRKNCRGKTERIKVAGRSAHFCNHHQQLR